MLIALIVLIPLVAALAYLRLPKFGRLPRGKRKARIRTSPHFRNGAFQNLFPTPMLTEGVGHVTIFREFFFGDKTKVRPDTEIPSAKTDLMAVNRSSDLLVWFGHSSYLLQVSGKRFLVDPVLCGSVSPFSVATKAFTGTDPYTCDDIPDIDYLLITHDHWDHLDYDTLRRLRPKIRQVICGLGVGEHLERWDYDPNTISELDWHEEVSLDNGMTLHALPSRHLSGRMFVRCRSLWVSFVLKTPALSLFLGCDGGYGPHFAEIGKEFGPFDLVILENGQYDKSWKHIHMTPEKVLMAAENLRAKRLFPIHSGKFVLANHAWHEPLARIAALSHTAEMPLITPLIGEWVALSDGAREYARWWESVR